MSDYCWRKVRDKHLQKLMIFTDYQPPLNELVYINENRT